MAHHARVVAAVLVALGLPLLIALASYELNKASECYRDQEDVFRRDAWILGHEFCTDPQYQKGFEFRLDCRAARENHARGLWTNVAQCFLERHATFNLLTLNFEHAWVVPWILLVVACALVLCLPRWYLEYRADVEKRRIEAEERGRAMRAFTTAQPAAIEMLRQRVTSKVPSSNLKDMLANSNSSKSDETVGFLLEELD